jgi:hypothetical protein
MSWSVPWLFSACSILTDRQWNGILGLHLWKEHILCIKARSVEAYSIPELQEQNSWSASGTAVVSSTRGVPQSSRDEQMDTLPATGLVYHFPTRSFRGYSLSSPTQMSASSSRFMLLGYDVLRGLSVYAIELQRTDMASVLPLILEVRCVGEHSLATSVGEGSSTAAHGFVSACCVGSEGKRGLWIERARASMRRTITVFTIADLGSDGDGDIKGHAVHEDTSYDLMGALPGLRWSKREAHCWA